MKALKRIEEESIEYQSKVAGENQNMVRHTYRDAAKYERNKTIDDAIEICYECLNSTYASVVVEQLETLRIK